MIILNKNLQLHIPSIIVYLIIISSAVNVVLDQCPNDCSQRGYCNHESTCVCDSLYTLAPDCSLSTILYCI